MQNKINYRLGNIIDNWYSKEYNNKKIFDFNFMININNSFGKFLQYNAPKYLNNSPSTHLLSCANWYWIYDYIAIKDMYPDFNNSLRHAIDDYFTQKIIIETLPVINTNTNTNTCVIYLETSSYIIDINILLHTITTFSNIPDQFDILTDITIEKGSKEQIYIYNMKSELKIKYPNAKINIINSNSVDEDFYRMITAKMLLTGTGSLSIAAAAANIHERRTPEFKNINHSKNTTTSLQVYENWYTYII